MRFLSGSGCSQDFFGNVYGVDRGALDKKTPRSEAVKDKRYNSGSEKTDLTLSRAQLFCQLHLNRWGYPSLDLLPGW